MGGEGGGNACATVMKGQLISCPLVNWPFSEGSSACHVGQEALIINDLSNSISLSVPGKYYPRKWNLWHC